jgi:ubiquitin-conjugating enzyme E2 O
MVVVKTRTSVDVLWQDGKLQHSAPSASVAPFEIVNDQEFFPGQYVIDNAPACSAHGPAEATAILHNDGILADGTRSTTRRAGVVREVYYKDQTVRVSWLNEEHRDHGEGNYTAVSTYDLKRDPEHSAYYGDVVVRLPSTGSDDGGGTPPVLQPPAEGNNMKNAAADLSWVGCVVDLPDGHVQVKWGDGSTSTVCMVLTCGFSIFSSTSPKRFRV